MKNTKRILTGVLTGAMLYAGSFGVGLAASFTTTDALNIRAGATTNSQILGVLPAGSKVDGEIEGGWLKFTSGGKTAYLSKDYLRSIETGEAKKPAKQKSGIYAITETLNVRLLPSVESKKLGLISPSEIRGVVRGDWLEILYNGTLGYVTMQYVKSSDAQTDSQYVRASVEPAEKEEKAKAETQAVSFKGWTTDALRVRKLASVDSDTLAVLPVGTAVEGTLEGDWVAFSYNGERAYVHRNYLSDKPVEKTEEALTPEQSSGISGMVALAKSKVGCPYQFAASGPNAFDCSGFVAYLYREVMGIQLPRNSEAQYNALTRVSMDDLRAGDILYYPGHVAFYIGGGQYIHASTYGVGVVYGNMSDAYSREFVAALRVVQ